MPQLPEAGKSNEHILPFSLWRNYSPAKPLISDSGSQYHYGINFCLSHRVAICYSSNAASLPSQRISSGMYKYFVNGSAIQIQALLTGHFTRTTKTVQIAIIMNESSRNRGKSCSWGFPVSLYAPLLNPSLPIKLSISFGCCVDIANSSNFQRK